MRIGGLPAALVSASLDVLAMAVQPSIPVFDVGGVLLDWDPRYLYRKLIADEAEMEAFLATVCAPDWNLAQDAGRPWAEAVAERIGRFPEHAALIRAYDERWQEMVPRAFDDTVAVMDELKRAGRPLYAITNFSAEKFDLERERWPFLNRFDGIVVSAEARCVKPHAAIYHRLLDTYGLDAGDCLFIDDAPANVDGARAVGMHAHHFRDAAELRQVLAAYAML